MHVRRSRRIQQRPTNEVHIKQYVRSTYPFSWDYVSICGDCRSSRQNNNKSTSRLAAAAAAARLYTTILRRRSHWPNKNQSQVTHKSQLFHRFFTWTSNTTMVNAAREKWPTIVLTGSLAGADNENSMLNHDYSVSFHFSAFVVVVVFLIQLVVSTHTRNSIDGIRTWRSENRVQRKYTQVRYRWQLCTVRLTLNRFRFGHF